ncbi:MAG: LON peptidase substrate-binding domain-containing protein, partial [Duodenibacillus sp.]
MPQQPEVLTAPVLPIRDIVVFPHMVVPLFVGRPKTVRAVQQAARRDNRLILVTQRDSQTDDPTFEQIHRVGCMATVLQTLKLADGTLKVLVEAQGRVAMDAMKSSDEKGYEGTAHTVATTLGDARELEALRRVALQEFLKFARETRKVTEEQANTAKSIDNAEELCDVMGGNLPTSIAHKQELLSEMNLNERYKMLRTLIAGEIDISMVEKRIQGRVKVQMEKSQRNYYLQEQMKAIQKELGGEEADTTDEFKQYRDKIAASGMSPEAEEKAQSELKKLRMMPSSSSEATVVRGYLDTLLELPWKQKTEVSGDLVRAREILDNDHWGLEKVKDRILEYLAVQRRVDKVKSPILCLVGGPGVGKTSLGESIARATGRKFVRMALGGVHDESEIRGHRRTYIGSMPGKVLQSMIKVGVRNPLFLLDEIDKIGADYRGDPAAALLEVLDPEQNRTFQDHYVDVDFDLSDVMFVATSNSYNIPPALLDRMEVINLSGYTE